MRLRLCTPLASRSAILQQAWLWCAGAWNAPSNVLQGTRGVRSSRAKTCRCYRGLFVYDQRCCRGQGARSVRKWSRDLTRCTAVRSCRQLVARWDGMHPMGCTLHAAGMGFACVRCKWAACLLRRLHVKSAALHARCRCPAVSGRRRDDPQLVLGCALFWGRVAGPGDRSSFLPRRMAHAACCCRAELHRALLRQGTCRAA